ncbi:MAG: FKBP-type peptidyl-prolyl cis-trans isomerase [Alphaproteobacteria bacterium]|nr:FKBP-type peptidyl-prolyl cis-trans isomerase [Alphaproteobacteria bacterium]
MTYTRNEIIGIVVGVIFFSSFLFGGIFNQLPLLSFVKHLHAGYISSFKNATRETPVSLYNGGVIYVDDVIGEGKEVKVGDAAHILYEGKYIHTTTHEEVVFFNSKDQKEPVIIPVGDKNIIPGLSIALIGMREGGVRIVQIDPTFAYGSEGNTRINIPGNTPLIFQIYLLKISK